MCRTKGRKWGFTAITCEEVINIFNHLHFIWEMVWSSPFSLSVCFCRHCSTLVFQCMKRQRLKISKIPVLAVLKPVNLKENVCFLQYSVLSSTFHIFKCRSTIRGFSKAPPCPNLSCAGFTWWPLLGSSSLVCTQLQLPLRSGPHPSQPNEENLK